ncbi:MAG: ribosome assembly RNA-binding protein YhbY [Clostridia bacterium]|nr:ribosome assembly RNA-binding protein YhbY [Clostridia bacterium]
MTSKQRAYLRSLAMTMSPIINIGKNGVTDSVIAEVDNLLECKELIKISVLNNSDLEAKDVANFLAENTKATIVQTVGNKITLFRVSKKDDIKHINLPQ